MNKKDRVYPPKKTEPDDTVGTIYCGENSEEYNNIMSSNDALPSMSPLPPYRRKPDPPII